MTHSTIRFKFIKLIMILTLFLGIVVTSCKKTPATPPPPPADKTALQASITVAQGLMSSTVEGTKPGQYEVGSQAALLIVLNPSKAVK